MQIEGIVMTMHDSRTNLSRQVVEEVGRYFPTLSTKPSSRGASASGEAPSFGKSIIEYAPTCSGAVAYRELAQEFLARHRSEVRAAS